jgi:hypothetical protein
MEPSKRAWIWGGLNLAPGVGLVAAVPKASPGLPPRRRIAPDRRVLVLGGTLASGLASPLQQLAREARVVLKVHAVPGAPAAATHATVVAEGKTLVLVVLEPEDVGPDASQPLAQLVKKLRQLGVEAVWVAPLSDGSKRPARPQRSDVFPSDALQIPKGPDGRSPTAIGYAGWAGAIWRWLG